MGERFWKECITLNVHLTIQYHPKALRRILNETMG